MRFSDCVGCGSGTYIEDLGPCPSENNADYQELVFVSSGNPGDVLLTAPNPGQCVWMANVGSFSGIFKKYHCNGSIIGENRGSGVYTIVMRFASIAIYASVSGYTTPPGSSRTPIQTFTFSTGNGCSGAYGAGNDPGGCYCIIFFWAEAACYIPYMPWCGGTVELVSS